MAKNRKQPEFEKAAGSHAGNVPWERSERLIPGASSPEEILMDRESGVLEASVPFENFIAKHVAEDVRRYYHRLPPRDVDYLTLYFEHRLSQLQIATVFGVTQAAVSYSLGRALRKVRWLCTVPEFDRAEVEKDLGTYFTQADRDIVWNLYDTTSQTITGQRMGLPQGRVRHAFVRTFKRLKALDAFWEVERLRQAGLPVRAPGEPLRAPGRAIPEGPSPWRKYMDFFESLQDHRWGILQIVRFEAFKRIGEATIVTMHEGGEGDE